MSEPVVSLIAAVSIDGKIAKYSGHNSSWTSVEDKEFLHQALNEHQAVVVGRKTYELAKEALSSRKCIVFTRSEKLGSEPVGENLSYINPDSDDFVSNLKKAGLKSVAVLGGTEVYSYFIEQGLIDNLYLTIEPVVFGKGLGLFNTRDFIEQNFKLKEIRPLNKQGTLLLHYQT